MFGEIAPKISILRNFLNLIGFRNDGVNNLIISPGTFRPYMGGTDNVFIGQAAGNADNNNSSVIRNTAVGSQAMSGLTTGQQNTAVGRQAAQNLTTGALNTAFGVDALQTVTTNIGNTAIGAYAMGSADNSVGGAVSANTAVGAYALSGGGVPASNTGTLNTAVGYQALSSFTTDTQNVAVGYQSLTSISGASGGNVAVGYRSGNNITGGLGANTIIGGQAGTSLVSPSGTTLIGNNTDAGSTSSNRTAIGNGANCGADNTSQIGNGSMTQFTVGTSNTASVKALNVPKAYGKVTGATGSRVVNDGFNVSSITDNAAGDITYNFTTAFSDANYSVTSIAEAQVNAGAIANARHINVYNGGQLAGSCRLQCYDNTGTTDLLKDPTAWHFTALGKQ